MPPLAPAVEKALARLADALAAGAPYEGQQVVKTVSARLRARGGTSDAADLTAAGAAAQLAAGQVRERERKGRREEGGGGVRNPPSVASDRAIPPPSP